MENDDHHIFEDETRALTEEDHVKTSTRMIQYVDHFSTSILGKILAEDYGYIINEDNYEL